MTDVGPDRLGGPEVLDSATRRCPELLAGTLLVRNRAIAVKFGDLTSTPAR